MRSIRELLEVSKEDLPDIYCDMDGVLCNFMKAADKVVKMTIAKALKDSVNS